MGTNPKRELIDYEAASRILAERGIPPECPICGANAWGPMGPLSNLYLALPLADLSGQLVEGGGLRANSLALAFTCGNCGFMRLVSEDMLARIRDEGGQ